MPDRRLIIPQPLLLCLPALLIAACGSPGADLAEDASNIARVSVISLSLIDADTDAPLAGFDPLEDGTIIDLAALPTRNLNLRANTAPAEAGSVRFGLNETTKYRIDDVAPWSLAGDSAGDYAAWALPPGRYVVTASAYARTGARGPAGQTVTVGFTIVDGGAGSAPSDAGSLPDAGADAGSVSDAGTGADSGAADEVFPAFAGLINVKQYGARGDGLTDDTAAIKAAIAASHASSTRDLKTVYFPNGTYLVSDTLLKRTASGEWLAHFVLQGESRSGTILRLKDSAPGYGDPAAPKAVIYTASFHLGSGTPSSGWTQLGEGNEGYHNYIYDLTVETGSGNPGAVGIDFLGHNIAAIRRVAVRSTDGAGRAGISMTRRWPGPLLLNDVSIDGFSYGIELSRGEYSITIERLTLANQKVVGLSNEGNIISIHDFASRNAVPAARLAGAGAMLNVFDAQLEGGSSAVSAIQVVSGKLFARNVNTTGYRSAIETQGGTVLPGATVTEYATGPGFSIFPSTMKSMNLPIQTGPDESYPPLSAWRSVTDFGAKPNDGIDDTAGIQAAIDSGAQAVYFPTGQYHVKSTLHVRGSVRNIIGNFSQLVPVFHHSWKDTTQPTAVFQIDGGGPVLIERIRWYGSIYTDSKAVAAVFLDHASSATVALKDFQVGGAYLEGIRNAVGAGPLFLENTTVTKVSITSQNVWGRQLNPEGTGVQYRNAGGKLWVLGIKTEKAQTTIETVGGGSTEVLGGFLYPASSVPSDLPAFISDESALFVIYCTGAFLQETNDHTTHIRETRGGEVRSLMRSQLPRRSAGSYGTMVPFFSGQP